MDSCESECSVCGRGFEPRFRYQVREEAGRFLYFCSQLCQQRSLEARDATVCSVCERSFSLEYPYQVAVDDCGKTYYCSPGCRQVGPALSKRHRKIPTRIAVFNHKGGTGKTTTAVNLAAGLAEQGERVLLVDADGQGNVGASLGIRGEQTLYHVIVHGVPAEQAAVPVRKNLDVLTSNELLAAAELYLAERPNRDRILRERLGDRVRGYDVIVIDCAPALSLMNQNVLVYADSVLVPVSCDYLSLVGVKQVLRTLKSVRDLLGHEVDLLGVIPTFYDVRNKICAEAVEALTEHFGDRRLPPIRVNTRLREAPRAKQTIFEHAPDSNGAQDYLELVRRIRALRHVDEGTRHSTVPPLAPPPPDVVTSRVVSLA
jgi:chromosome partitioning protein